MKNLGLWLRHHHAHILTVQWVIVLFYVVVVALPAFLPLPGETDTILNNLTRFAQFLFWGIWWPFVILSVMTLGRTWCGLLCPEGALTEFAARWSLNWHIPAWLKWPGWPFVAFVLTTLFGQMTSVYEYPKPALLILGGSTVAAIITGLLFGRNKRVWCRYLCPVSGVFALLARIAPVHFAVDRQAWDNPIQHSPLVNCAPLLNIRRMQSASNCHMCGRCAGQRGAVMLAWRSPQTEILNSPPVALSSDSNRNEVWLARLLVFGMLGVALGAFQWSASPGLVMVKQQAAEWLISQEIGWPLESPGYWWLLTYYPEANDVVTWLDGGVLLAYIALTALVSGGWIGFCFRIVAAWTGLAWSRLVMVLIPFAGISVFVGLSLLTTGQLFGEGIEFAWANLMRMGLLAVSALWSVALAGRLAGLPGIVGTALAVILPLWAWYQQFYIW